MCQEDRTAKDEKRARRKQRIEKIAYAIALPMVCAYLALFIRIALVGYLTWIAITAGILFLTPQILMAVIGLMGKRTLVKRLGWAWICLMVAMLLAWGILAFWPQGLGPWRQYSFDAELAALEAKRAVPNEENAALRYEKALAAIDPDDRPEFVFGGANLRDRLTRRPWMREDHAQVSDWLDSYASVVTELLQIGQMEHCRWPTFIRYDDIWSVPYRKLSHGAYLLTLAGNRHLGEGRLEEALAAYFSLLRQGEHLQQQTFILDFHYSYGAEESALDMIRYVLVHNELSPEDINRIAQRLPDSANTWQRDAQRLMDFEEYRFVDLLARAYEINEQGRIRFARSRPISLENDADGSESTWKKRQRPLGYCLSMPLEPHDVWPMARDEFREIRRFLDPGPLLPKKSHALDSPGMFSASTIRLGCNPLRFAARDIAFDTYAYADWGERYAENLTYRRGTWLVLGLRKYRDEHRAWPPSLDRIAQYVPADALLDPTRGERFVYRLNEDGFTLYGTGINGIDEDGRWDGVKALDGHEDDIVIWPIRIQQPPEHPSPESQEEMLRQLKEIYGDRLQMGKPEDANGV